MALKQAWGCAKWSKIGKFNGIYLYFELMQEKDAVQKQRKYDL